jgi:co-chaperonin GroES (HSP10)
MKPLKEKLIYKFITRQDGAIALPDTIKNRSSSSVVVEINSDNKEIQVGDIIMHNMHWNNKARTFLKNGEEHKIMSVEDVYAKVIRGQIIPVNDWYLCKMVIPKHLIEGVLGVNDCKSIILAAAPITNKLPVKIGWEYIIPSWEPDMVQFNIEGGFYLFLKAERLIAEIIKPLAIMN